MSSELENRAFEMYQEGREAGEKEAPRYTLEDIASELGVTIERIRQIILRKLRSY